MQALQTSPLPPPRSHTHFFLSYWTNSRTSQVSSEVDPCRCTGASGSTRVSVRAPLRKCPQPHLSQRFLDTTRVSPSTRKVIVRVKRCETILRRISFVILLGSSRHTRLARCFHHVPDISFFLLGALLRIYLNDDSACVVEDFLFVLHSFTLETCVFRVILMLLLIFP